MKSNFLCYLLLVAAPNTYAADSDDQYQLDTVTVTATKTGETNLQVTPISITAFDDYDLLENNVSDIHGINHLTPNLSIGQNTFYAQVFIWNTHNITLPQSK